MRVVKGRSHCAWSPYQVLESEALVKSMFCAWNVENVASIGRLHVRLLQLSLPNGVGVVVCV